MCWYRALPQYLFGLVSMLCACAVSLSCFHLVMFLVLDNSTAFYNSTALPALPLYPLYRAFPSEKALGLVKLFSIDHQRLHFTVAKFGSILTLQKERKIPGRRNTSGRVSSRNFKTFVRSTADIAMPIGGKYKGVKDKQQHHRKRAQKVWVLLKKWFVCCL